ncbi:MAG: ATPase, partial [Clostridia bacterium]|nr:ATPase [Clostridia bacterium]
YVMPEDVRSLAAPVLAHRLSLSPEARISQKNASEAKALTRLIASLPVPVRAK